MNKKYIRTLTTNIIVAAVYVTITLLFGVLSFGVIQIRLSEGLNHLICYNKRYFLGIVLGVIIANVFSPLGLIDVFVGTFQTVAGLGISLLIFKKVTDVKKRMMVNIAVMTVSMFIIALELTYVFGLPFWPTYATVALGEAISMTIGELLIYQINKVIDFKEKI